MEILLKLLYYFVTFCLATVIVLIISHFILLVRDGSFEGDTGPR